MTHIDNTPHTQHPTENEKFLKVIKFYFNARPDKEEEAKTIAEITASSKFRGANLWILIFAILIASLGLNINSTAVIIGAMLISPLMGPIVGMGLGVGINNFELLRKSFKNYLISTIISVLTATFYFLLSPISNAQSELLARTTPTIYDVLIALCGGAAGIIAIATKGKGNVIPGVAIATALMPPLCTAGYGLAIGEAKYFFGAFYLFFINTVFIALATYIGVRMLHFKPKVFANPKREKTIQHYIIALLIITLTPATWLTMGIVRDSVRKNNVSKFIRTGLSWTGTQILSHELNEKQKKIEIVAIGKRISDKHIEAAQNRLSNYNLQDYTLHIIQGEQTDSILINRKLSAFQEHTSQKDTEILQQSQKIKQLTQELEYYTHFSDLSKDICSEIKTLFPKVKKIALAPVVIQDVDSTASTPCVVAFITIYPTKIPRYASKFQREKIKKEEENNLKKIKAWLQARTKNNNLEVITKEA